MRTSCFLIAIVFVTGCGGKSVAPPVPPQSHLQQQASFERLENQLQQIQQAVSTLQRTNQQTTRLEADLRRSQQEISQKLEALQNLITSALPSPRPPQGQSPSTPSVEESTPSIEVQVSHRITERWSRAIEKWSAPRRNHRYYRGAHRTQCDLFVRDVFAECRIDAFQNRSINQLHDHLSTQWDTVSGKEAADRAAKAIPTVAITIKGEPPGSHIAVLLGALDGRGRPKVRGAGAFSGPKGKPHPPKPSRIYRGGTYDGLGWHWKSSHFTYITYFSMPDETLESASSAFAQSRAAIVGIPTADIDIEEKGFFKKVKYGGGDNLIPFTDLAATNAFFL